MTNTILCCGFGGFIGGHFLPYLLENTKDNILAVDIKSTKVWFQLHKNPRVINIGNRDLRNESNVRSIFYDQSFRKSPIKQIFNFACDRGGIGYITSHQVNPLLSSLINTHLLQAAVDYKVEKYLFSSLFLGLTLASKWAGLYLIGLYLILFIINKKDVKSIN